MHGKLARILRHSATAMLVTLGAVGCAERDPEPLWPEPRALGRDIRAFRPVGGAAKPVARSIEVEEPAGTIRLREALALALVRSPKLAAASWAVRAADARALQEGLMPNPEVRVRMDDFGGAGEFEGTRYSEQGIRLSQVIELGGKAAKRRRTARLEAALCGWDYETTRLDVFTETTKAFVAVLAAQKRLAAAQEMHDLAEQVMSLVSRRVRGGAGSDLETDEARIELGSSRIDLEQARQALEADRAVLASHWDEKSPRFRGAIGDLEDMSPTQIPPWEQVLARIEGNPDVSRWETEARMRQAALEREKANGIPDVRVLLGNRRLEETGDYGYSVALEVSLPIFDRNQGSIREARFNCVKARYEHRAATMVAVATLRQAYQSLSISRRTAVLLKNEVLPAAQRALGTTRRALEGGTVTDLQLLKAQRTLFKARTRQIDALEVFHVSVADVERLIGQPISDLRPSDRPDSPTRRRTPAEPSGKR